MSHASTFQYTQIIIRGLPGPSLLIVSTGYTSNDAACSQKVDMRVFGKTGSCLLTFWQRLHGRTKSVYRCLCAGCLWAARSPAEGWLPRRCGSFADTACCSACMQHTQSASGLLIRCPPSTMCCTSCQAAHVHIVGNEVWPHPSQQLLWPADPFNDA